MGCKGRRTQDAGRRIAYRHRWVVVAPFSLLLVLTACDSRTVAPSDNPMPPSFNTAGQPGTRGPVRSLDDDFSDLALEVPGFGGLYYDTDGTLTVRLKNPGQAEAARAPVSAFLVRRADNNSARLGRIPAEVAGMRVVPADYDFRELRTWSDRMLSVLAVEGVIYTDIDESRNRVSVGVQYPAAGAAVEARIAQIGVPAGAVIVEQTEPIRYATTLNDTFRPVRGGFVIEYSGFRCTLGFNAKPASDTTLRAFLTNSHCSDVRGVVTPTQYFQAAFTQNLIGTEYADPAFFTGGACPSGRQCRYSDAILALYAPTVSWDFPFIARTMSRGTTTGSLVVNDANPVFRITASRLSSPLVGTDVEKVGRTTGWTHGPVIQSCANSNVNGTNITMLCQDRVSAGAQGGDSGSPVFFWFSQATDVTLFGLLWGGNESGTEFVFSNMSNIHSELGALWVFPSTSEPPPPPPPPPPGECDDPSVPGCPL